MSGLLILILIFIGFPILWRWLRPFLYRWMQRRTEDYMRRAMGMPPRDRSQSRSNGKESRQSSGYSSHRSGRGSRQGRHTSGPIIPKEYAVDVEYTEIRSYSAEETIASEGQHISYSVESQVSDAEIIEISKER